MIYTIDTKQNDVNLKGECVITNDLNLIELQIMRYIIIIKILSDMIQHSYKAQSIKMKSLKNENKFLTK